MSPTLLPLAGFEVITNGRFWVITEELELKSRDFIALREGGKNRTPTHSQWKDAGDMLAKALRLRPDLRNKLPSLFNDCLLALSAR